MLATMNWVNAQDLEVPHIHPFEKGSIHTSIAHKVQQFLPKPSRKPTVTITMLIHPNLLVATNNDSQNTSLTLFN